MKIKLVYELEKAEGGEKKSYTKTFANVNEAATKENFESFAGAYLKLYQTNGSMISYKIYKTNEELITSNIA